MTGTPTLLRNHNKVSFKSFHFYLKVKIDIYFLLIPESAPGPSRPSQDVDRGVAVAGPSTLEAGVPHAESTRSRNAPHRQRAAVVTEEVLERQDEICRQLVIMNQGLLSINETLNKINDSLKK